MIPIILTAQQGQDGKPNTDRPVLSLIVGDQERSKLGVESLPTAKSKGTCGFGHADPR